MKRKIIQLQEKAKERSETDSTKLEVDYARNNQAEVSQERTVN